MSVPTTMTDQVRTRGMTQWLHRLFVPRSTPGWFLVYVRTKELRFPIILPIPVGWARDIVRGARFSLVTADRVSAGRLGDRVMKYLPAQLDWYTADIDLKQGLPSILAAVEQVLSELLAGKSYTMIEVHDEDTRVSVRIV